MSIQAIARDVYKAQQKVDHLEKQIETVSPKDFNNTEQELRLAKIELKTLRKILDGEKESASFRKKFQGFGQ